VTAPDDPGQEAPEPGQEGFAHAAYRPRPGQVLAIRCTGTNAAEVTAMIGGPSRVVVTPIQMGGPGRGTSPGLNLSLPGRTMQVRAGDWITCPPGGFPVSQWTEEMFAQLYQPDTDQEARP
jgi:hypothetical protein